MAIPHGNTASSLDKYWRYLYNFMLKISELTEMAADWKQIRPSTRRMWEITTRDIANFDAESFRRTDAIRVSGSMRKKYAAGTVRSRIGYLGSIWKVGITMELLNENVWTGLYEGLKKPCKKYEHKNLEHFLAFHEDPLFMGLWLHGFRVNELACLLPVDIVTDAAIPYFNIRHNPTRFCKNDTTQRQVPIHPAYIRFIEKFPFSTNPKAGDNFSRRLKTATGISAHGIRHMFVTRMRQAGIEYSIAMAIIGHKPTGMTADYGDVLMEDIYEQLQKLR